MKNLSCSSLVLTTLLALQGCGGSGDSTSNTAGASGATGNGGEGGGDSNAAPIAAMEGNLKFDFSLRSYNGNDFAYSTDLTTKISSEFSEGDYLATNLFVGGVNADDFYAPAIVSASPSHIRIASRIDGSSATVDIPAPALQEQRIPCSLAATANSNGATGVVALRLAKPADGSCGQSAQTWVYSYSKGAGTWWQASGAIDTRDIHHSKDGDIDFIVASSSSGNALNIYNQQGGLLNTVTAHTSQRGTDVLSLDAGGPTRDDGYVAIIVDETIRVTSRRMLIESGLAGSSVIKSNLSADREIITVVNKFNERGVILRSGDDLILIDSARRNAKRVADISGLTSDAWMLDEVSVLGNQLILNFSKFESTGDSFHVRGKLARVDLTKIEDGIEHITTSQSEIRQARATGAMFFNVTTTTNELKAIVVKPNGSIAVSDNRTFYVSGVNLEKGGKEIETFLLAADSVSAEGRLVDPEIWTVNEFTGSPDALKGNVAGECEWFMGAYGVGSHVNAATMCNGSFSWQRVDTDTGDVRFVSSKWEAVF